MTVFEIVAKWMRVLIGRVIWQVFKGWVRLTGREVGPNEAPWLDGHFSARSTVGADILDEVAARDDLLLEWSNRGGLLPSFKALAGEGFDPSQVDEAVHAFYEKTAAHSYEVTPRWYTPISWFASATIATACRIINQFNLPLTADEAARGMTNEVVHMRDRRSGERRQTFWLRRSKGRDRVIFAGIYGIGRLPDPKSSDPASGEPASSEPTENCTACVKVVFPLPDGYICVLLKPTVHPDGGLELISRGDGFGDPGFYWVQNASCESKRVKYIRLHESIRVYVDESGELLTDHTFSLWGRTFLWLRYDIDAQAESHTRSAVDATAAQQPCVA